MLGRITTLIYGAFCYLVFFATLLYAIGFIDNLFVPKAMDSGRSGPLVEALAIDAALLALFAIQHSVMARQWFKRAWTAIIPPAAERSTYVLFSSLALVVLFWQWRPIGGTIWQVDNPMGRAVILSFYVLGYVIVLVATFLINHFDLFGLRQTWMRFRSRAYTSIGFQTPGFYKLVRHPLYVGWFFVFWSAPTMTATHLVFSVATTAYILIAIRFEERDLVATLGDSYQRYREEVPMLIPRRVEASRVFKNQTNR
jgi:protein-S-isoprenylcysteine O-methyltransferase Ste14